MNSTVTESYRLCKKLSRRFGSTYYWAASVLDAQQRIHVYALYAFCRSADDIVDVAELSDVQRGNALAEFGNRFFTDLDRGASTHPLFTAVVNTAVELQLPREYFERFMDSMAMDLSTTRYETFDDLLGYMEGSAAVIGEMMIPVLQPSSYKATQAARDLGIAFQLTNFLRDVGEDVDRNRVYLPQETFRHFGADPYLQQITPEWKAAMQFEIARARTYYDAAADGINYLTGRSRTCVRAAHRLYGQILDRIEANDYDVFTKRARVAQWKKLAVAGSTLRSRA